MLRGRTRNICDAITQDPANATRILIRTQPFNYARKLVRGIDFDASYRLPLDRLFAGARGNFTLHGVATRYIENISDTGIAGQFRAQHGGRERRPGHNPDLDLPRQRGL